MWTPSLPHFTSWWTTSASPIGQEGSPAPSQPSPKARSSPSPSSPVGPGLAARGTSTATPQATSERHSLPCLIALSSTAACDLAELIEEMALHLAEVLQAASQRMSLRGPGQLGDAR